MSKITMVCGAPGSAKSTLTKTLVEQGAISLNRDTEGGTIAGLLPKMEKLLSDNKDIVLDNLFTTIAIRKPFIDLAKQYNVDINCMLMDTSIEDSQFNVIQRMIDITGKLPSLEEIKKSKHPNIFPVVVLFKYKKEFEKPTITEGFSKVETIKFVRKDNSIFTNKALILDYDSTLRECVGGNGKYPTEKEHVKILPNRTEVLQKYKDNGYILLGCSNQSGVAKGDLTLEKCQELFDYTNELLGHDIDVAFCPHQSAPPVCYCRKPQVANFVHLMNKYKLNRKEVIFVGDATSDKSMATRCGIKYVDQAEFFK